MLGQNFLVVLCWLTLSIPSSSITLVSKLSETCCYTHNTFLLGSSNGRVIYMYQEAAKLFVDDVIGLRVTGGRSTRKGADPGGPGP